MNRKLSEWVKREVLGLIKPEREEIKLSEADLEALAGTYEVVGQTYVLSTKPEGDKLALTIPDAASGSTQDLTLRFLEQPTKRQVFVLAPFRAAVGFGDRALSHAAE